MSRKSGLGRGLDALLPAHRGDDGLEERSALHEVDIDAIDPNPRQPRERFDDESLAELAHSVKELGVLQALLVRESGGGRYELIAGERRLRAARRVGLGTVPVMVVETDEQGSLERALVENVHRANLNPIEEAAAYKQMLDEGGMTQESLASRIGKNRVTVTTTLRLLELPISIQRYLIDGRIAAGHGRALLGLRDSPFVEKLARRVAEEGMSVRETERLVKRYQAMDVSSRGPTAGSNPRPPEVTEAQRRLAEHLQTRVRVDMGKRKGKIELDFVSLEELHRLLEVILGDARDDGPRVVSPD